MPTTAPVACIIANSATGDILAQANAVVQAGDASADAQISAVCSATRVLREQKAPIAGQSGTYGSLRT